MFGEMVKCSLHSHIRMGTSSLLVLNNESVKITVLSSINTSLQSGTIGLSGPFKTTYWQELFTILLILLQFQSVTGHLFTKAQTK